MIERRVLVLLPAEASEVAPQSAKIAELGWGLGLAVVSHAVGGAGSARTAADACRIELARGQIAPFIVGIVAFAVLALGGSFFLAFDVRVDRPGGGASGAGLLRRGKTAVGRDHQWGAFAIVDLRLAAVAEAEIPHQVIKELLVQVPSALFVVII